MNINQIKKSGVLCISFMAGVLFLNSCRQPDPPPQPEPVRPQPVQVIERTTPEKSVSFTADYPSEVYVGQPYEYTINLTNDIPDCGVGNVIVEQELSEGFEFISSSPQGFLEKGTNTVTWKLGDMDPGESKSIRVRGQATRSGSVVNCTEIDFQKKICGEVVAVAPELDVTKTMKELVYACQTIPVKITVSNPGTGTVKNVKVQDQLPSGLSAENGQQLMWTIPELRQGETKEFHYNAVPSQAGVYQGTVTASSEHLSDQASASVKVIKPILTITKTSSEKAFIGRKYMSEITVTNTGDAPAQQFVIKDVVPATAKLVAASNGGVNNGTMIQWTLPDLAPNDSVTVSAEFLSTAPGVQSNTATAMAYCAEAVSATSSTNVVGIPAILLEVVDVEDPISVGDNETYIITATNQGSVEDTNIVISCTLEDSQSFVSASGPTQETVQGQTITFGPLPRLGAKQKASWRVTVKALKADDVRFSVKMTTDQLRRSVDETEATNQY